MGRRHLQLLQEPGPPAVGTARNPVPGLHDCGCLDLRLQAAVSFLGVAGTRTAFDSTLSVCWSQPLVFSQCQPSRWGPADLRPPFYHFWIGQNPLPDTPAPWGPLTPSQGAMWGDRAHGPLKVWRQSHVTLPAPAPSPESYNGSLSSSCHAVATLLPVTVVTPAAIPHHPLHSQAHVCPQAPESLLTAWDLVAMGSWGASGEGVVAATSPPRKHLWP